MTSTSHLSARFPATPKDLQTAFSEAMNLRKIERSLAISLKNKFVFCSIPKVASSSLKHFIYRMESYHPPDTIEEKLVHKSYYGPVIRPSMLGFDSQMLFDVLSSDEFFKFIFVRNPYARCLSNFLDRYQANHSTVRRQINRVAVDAGLIGKMSDDISFSNYLRAVALLDKSSADIHLMPQSDFGLFSILSYDFIGSFENLGPDLAFVCNHIWGRPEAAADIGFQSPSRTNAGEKLKKMLTDDDIALINQIYAKDFPTLGYRQVESIRAFDDPNVLLREKT